LQANLRALTRLRSDVLDPYTSVSDALSRNAFFHNVNQQGERCPGSGRRKTARGAAADHLTRSPGRARPR
jgi:hypothetical protein